MTQIQQIKLLLWKNWLITKRLYILTPLMILLPCFLVAILMAIRSSVKPFRHDNITTWPPCTFADYQFYGRHIGFTPNNSFTHRIMNSISQDYQLDYKGFQTEQEMVDYSVGSNVSRDFTGGIVFRVNSSGASNSWTFKIRMMTNWNNWHTNKMFPTYEGQRPRDSFANCGGNPAYYNSGFLTLQFALTKSLLGYLQPQSTGIFNQTELVLQRHPYPPYYVDFMVTMLQDQFPYILVMSFQLMVPTMVREIVEDKEKRLKEAMKMMGMSNWIHWLSWFIKYFIFLFISSCLMTLVLCVPVGSNGSVLGSTNPAILLLFFLIYSLASISLGFMLSTLFSKANTSAVATGFLFYFMFMPYEFIKRRYDSLGTSAKMSTCLLSNVALGYASRELGMREGQGVGVQWHNIAHGSSIDDPFSMLHIMLMLLLDALIYAIITWYIEAVFPGQYGIPLPWYFPFTKSYWCGTVPEDSSRGILPGVEQKNEFFEKEPNNLRAGIQINCMRKKFSGRKNVAVAGITLNMYEGQITALLGHNGAGKTTIISMLTGLIPPTSGTAYVNGYDILKDIRGVRDSLGICPQHDILFNHLTVHEHLQFFAKLKGFPIEKIQDECDKMLESIGLTEKRDSLPGKLSGGMKRKLSLGLAFIGGSKIVILDEPSSGLDPSARRQIWSMIEKNRAGRTMLLTTHFMDEADCLGDRIAIMSEGVLRCCGSALFLKSKYGAGYHLVMVKTPTCNVQTVDNLINSSIPQAKMESNVGTELCYLLPHESSVNFQELFRSVEEKQEELGISSYGVTITTMEEVFLRVSENLSEEEIQPEPNNSTAANNPPSSYISINKIEPMTFHKNYLNSGLTLNVQQFLTLLKKKALHSWRNKLFTLAQLTIPIIITALTVMAFPTNDVSPPLVLEPMAFGKNFIPFSIPLQPTNESMDISKMYALQFPDSAVVFQNINNMSDYKTEPNIIKYLGRVASRDLLYYNKRYQIAADFGYQLNGTFTSYFNGQSYHGSAISVGVMASALLKYFNGKDSSLVFINHPLPKPIREKLSEQGNGYIIAFAISLVLVFGLSFLSSSFSVQVIKERVTKAKHLQHVSGASPLNYWMATYIWDIFVALIPCILILAVFTGFDIEGYHGEEHSAHIFLLFFLYILSILPTTYLMSFLFNGPSTGLTVLTIYNVLVGVGTFLVVTLLRNPNLVNLIKILTWVFMAFFPQFCLSYGLTTYYTNYQASCESIIKSCPHLTQNHPKINCCPDKCGDNCLPMNENYLGWQSDGIGRMLFFMAIQSVIYFSIILLVESTYIRQLRYRLTNHLRDSLKGVDNKGVSDEVTSMDEDVENEQNRVTNGTTQYLVKTDLVVISNVIKRYGDFTAVDRLGVGIPRGECFGLLGVNGAGKTTAFKMLTGDEIISAGQIYINRLNVKTDMKKIYREIGYCPQFDAVIETMTGREILTMFAHLRGVHRRQIKQTVNEHLHQLMLEKYADEIVETYSGGNKRKLSTAVALVGNPPLILLDEPTTGMDPGTRRKLWNILIGVRDSGHTIILTSHSMDECEALCTRLAIMVNGQFRCMGSTQHLKSKFGEGYTLVAKMRIPEDSNTELDVNPLRNHIEEKFPGCEFKDAHQGVVHYQIGKNTSISWADLFGTLEEIKATFGLEAYSLGQSSLEQVFINFARAQRSAEELKPKSSKKKCCC